MLNQATPYRAETGRNLVKDVLDAELRSGRRIIDETEHWVLFVPGAAKWPVQMQLMPKRDVYALYELTDAEKEDLADIYLQMLAAGDKFFVEADGETIPLPYIAGWHQAPVGERREDLRLHLDFFSILRSPGKLKYLAGSESGMAAWISDTTPEKIAGRLREVYGK